MVALQREKMITKDESKERSECNAAVSDTTFICFDCFITVKACLFVKVWLKVYRPCVCAKVWHFITSLKYHMNI